MSAGWPMRGQTGSSSRALAHENADHALKQDQGEMVFRRPTSGHRRPVLLDGNEEHSIGGGRRKVLWGWVGFRWRALPIEFVELNPFSDLAGQLLYGD